MVFSWQVASHTAHCRPRMCCTEDFIAVFATDLSTVLQNTQWSEAPGFPITCRTARKRGKNWVRTEKCSGWHDTWTPSILSKDPPLSVVCVSSRSTSENWQCATEHKQALYTTASSTCTWSARGGTPVGEGYRKKGKEGDKAMKTNIKIQAKMATSTNYAFLIWRGWSTLDYP